MGQKQPQPRRTTMLKTLIGPVKTWKLFGNVRTFSEVTVPYGEFAELFVPVHYNALTGLGEQRDICPAHLRKLKNAMESGKYTPTPASAGLGKKHLDALVIQEGAFTLSVSSDPPLPLTDGGHRREALAAILNELNEKVAAATDEKEKKKLQAEIEGVLALPVTVTLYLNGDTQIDFVN